MKLEISIKTVFKSIVTVFVGGVLILYCITSDTHAEDRVLNDIPIKVQVLQVERFSQKESFAYSGTIEESESIPLGFPIKGTVTDVPVSEGDFIEAGQLLAVLDDATYSNMYDLSQATLQQAEDAFKRLKPMYENGNLPEIKYIEAVTRLQQARANAAISLKNLDDCKLYSPVEGFVGARFIEPGMNVSPLVTAIKIVKIDKVFARAPISESEIALIKKGQKASITIAALGKKQFEGIVEEIGVVADPIVHTYKIKIGIDNKDHSIKPGMICDARIRTSAVFSGVVIPHQAVQVDENGKSFVYGINEDHDRALRKYVEIGRLMSEGIEIAKGLAIGDLIVISGQHKLVNDSKIQIANR